MTTKKSEPVREAKPPKAAEVKKRTEKEPLMYVGPTVNGLGIQNRVYTEIPKAAEAVLEKTPELRNLFIPVRDYPGACRMLRERKGYIHSAFMKALNIKNGGK